MALGETPLEMAERHVREGEERVARQRQHIQEMTKDEQLKGLSIELLDHYERALYHFAKTWRTCSGLAARDRNAPSSAVVRSGALPPLQSRFRAAPLGLHDTCSHIGGS
jgi:hypothetical protein